MDLLLKASIARIMERHIGIENAISRTELLDTLWLDPGQDRSMRKAIESLRLDQDGLPVMFCEQGYYLPANHQEYVAGLQSWKARLKSEGQIYSRLRRNGERFLSREHQGSLL